MQLDPDIIANGKILGAASAGGIVRMFLRPAKGWAQAGMLMVSCVTCGFFATRPVMDWWSLPVEYAGAIGALAGFLGLSIAEGLLRAVDGFDFRALLSALLTKGGRA